MAVARDGEGRLAAAKRAGPGPAAERLRREAAALGVAAGSGCVELVDVADEPGGGVRLATAWVGGGSLATTPPLDAARVLEVGRALAAALAALHRRGVVHGRVVAEHVVLDGERPLLCGLGDARLPGEDHGPSPDDDVASLLVLLADLLDGARGDLADRLRGVLAAGAAGGAAAVVDRLGALAEPPAAARREVRPRRAPPERRPPVRGLIASGVAAVALLALAVGVLRSGSEATSERPPPTTTERCRAAGGTVDVDGDGCPDDVTVRDGVVAVGQRRWQVGAREDLAAVGDWDCDGRATAAVVHPRTGEVWVYERWATDGRPVPARPGPGAPGTTRVRAVPANAGCDRLEVTNAAGGRRLLDLG